MTLTGNKIANKVRKNSSQNSSKNSEQTEKKVNKTMKTKIYKSRKKTVNYWGTKLLKT